MQFVAPVTEESARVGITLWDVKENRAVEGELRPNNNRNRWYFEPKETLVRGNAYEIRVRDSVEGKLNGVSVGESSCYPFVF